MDLVSSPCPRGNLGSAHVIPFTTSRWRQNLLVAQGWYWGRAAISFPASSRNTSMLTLIPHGRKGKKNVVFFWFPFTPIFNRHPQLNCTATEASSTKNIDQDFGQKLYFGRDSLRILRMGYHSCGDHWGLSTETATFGGSKKGNGGNPVLIKGLEPSFSIANKALKSLREKMIPPSRVRIVFWAGKQVAESGTIRNGVPKRKWGPPMSGHDTGPHASCNQNPVSTWSIQNHFWPGLSITNLHLPGFWWLMFGFIRAKGSFPTVAEPQGPSKVAEPEKRFTLDESQDLTSGGPRIPVLRIFGEQPPCCPRFCVVVGVVLFCVFSKETERKKPHPRWVGIYFSSETVAASKHHGSRKSALKRTPTKAQ